MTDLIEKKKKQERLEIAERKVEKAWIRASKISKKLKKTDPQNKATLKEKLQDAFKRLKRNKKELTKVERKVS